MDEDEYVYNENSMEIKRGTWFSFICIVGCKFSTWQHAIGQGMTICMDITRGINKHYTQIYPNLDLRNKHTNTLLKL